MRVCERKKIFLSLFSKCPQYWPSQAEAWHQELHPGHPTGWQADEHLQHHLLPLKVQCRGAGLTVQTGLNYSCSLCCADILTPASDTLKCCLPLTFRQDWHGGFYVWFGFCLAWFSPVATRTYMFWYRLGWGQRFLVQTHEQRIRWSWHMATLF